MKLQRYGPATRRFTLRQTGQHLWWQITRYRLTPQQTDTFDAVVLAILLVSVLAAWLW